MALDGAIRTLLREGSANFSSDYLLAVKSRALAYIYVVIIISVPLLYLHGIIYILILIIKIYKNNNY